MKRPAIVFAIILFVSSSLRADGPADNDPQNVRRVPPLGIELTAEQREKLEAGLTNLEMRLVELKNRREARTLELLPDVEIYHRAVRDAVTYQEFFSPQDVAAAFELLDEGSTRADQLLGGNAPWTDQRGLVVRGFRSKLDGTVQPYGLVIPDSYTHQTAGRYRLDVWFHGRGETMSEVGFMQQRRKNAGIFTPPDTIVLHPYGRYSNAFKFAGEVDVLEALEATKRQYRVDNDRISVRGFSMGGAGCWQFAVHYPDRWFAANPGAGFSETPEFLKFFQKETLNPTWWEKKLWHWYDCTDWAVNLHHCPTVAYSGELDIQKQAADIMADALERQDIHLVHVIGPQSGHQYHPDAIAEVDRRLASIAEYGRERFPRTIKFTTYTLKYNHASWIRVDGLGEHWQRAIVEAHLDRRSSDELVLAIDVSNITDLTIDIPPGFLSTQVTDCQIVIGDDRVIVPGPQSDRSLVAPIHFDTNGHWRSGARPGDGLRKRHNLQGPIDDAFMDSFIFVKPTGVAQHKLVGTWTTAELDHAIEHWRRQFRGHARIVNDTDIRDEDIASANLVLWGDPASNSVLKRIAGDLPIKWDAKEIAVGERRFPSDHHAVIAIYPNPLNPNRYVVLNSSFTYREYAYLNNARQVPKLPDWAIVDLNTPPDSLWPGKIVDADFFDEQWQLRAPRGLDPE